MIRDRQSEPPAADRSRPRLVFAHGKLKIAGLVLAVVAVCAFAFGRQDGARPARTVTADSALDVPALVGLPTYTTSSARPAGPSASSGAAKASAASTRASNAAGAAAAAAGKTSAPAATTAPAADKAATQPATTTRAAAVSLPKPVGKWLLDGNALDSAGAHDGVASDVSYADGAAVLAGSNGSYIGTSGPVVNTGPGDSFSVSAWVDLTADPTSASLASTAVSQDANINSAFYLQYFGGTADCWSFTRMDTDTVLSNGSRAESLTTPKLNTWTHLIGVYDASNSAMYLYVNGNLEGTVKDTTPVASSGPLDIGRARYNSTAADAFAGKIKDVQVFDVALSAAQAAAVQ